MVSPVPRNVALVSANAMPWPSCGYIPERPRLPGRAFSTASSAAPPHSPPTAIPCRTRSASRTTGAAAPIAAVPGSRPTATLASPITSSV
jgi:hypothetical protein